MCQKLNIFYLSCEIMIDLLSFSKAHPESVFFLKFSDKLMLRFKLSILLPLVYFFLFPSLWINSENDLKTISSGWLRKFSLRTGDTVSGKIRPPKEGERYFALLKVDNVNFDSTEYSKHKILFEN